MGASGCAASEEVCPDLLGLLALVLLPWSPYLPISLFVFFFRNQMNREMGRQGAEPRPSQNQHVVTDAEDRGAPGRQKGA